MIDLCFYGTKTVKVKNKAFRVPYLSCLDWVLCYGTMCIYYELQVSSIGRKPNKRIKKLINECIKDLWKATKLKCLVTQAVKITVINEFIKINMPHDVLRWQDKYEHKTEDVIEAGGKDTYLLDMAHTLASVYHINPLEVLRMPFVAVNSLFSIIRKDRLLEEYIQLGVNIQSMTDIPDYESYKRLKKTEWENRRRYIKQLLSSNEVKDIEDPNTIKHELEILKSKAGYYHA